MKTTPWLTTLIVLAAACPSPGRHVPPPREDRAAPAGRQGLFNDGDRVSFVGSSIAMNGKCYHYTNLFYATRYPDRTVHFLNGGISGDHTDSILKRLERDILAGNPTHCVLMLEENDLQPRLYREDQKNDPNIKARQEAAVQHWIKNADLLVEKLQAKGVKVILQTPTIFDEVVESPTPNSPGINANLKRCADHLGKLAAKHSLPLVDCWTALNAVNQRIQKEDTSKSIIGRDRVHVSPQGYFVMAVAFLRAQKADGQIAHIAIDARENKATLSEKAAIADLNAKPTSVSFTAKAGSLPFPTPSEVNPDAFFPFTDELNADILRITGLEKGEYSLAIDDMPIATLTADELARGVNLSRHHDTPQYKQAEAVLREFEKLWKLESKQRAVTYVECLKPDLISKTNNLEETKANLEAFREKQKSGPNYSFFTNIFRSYVDAQESSPPLGEQSEAILRDISRRNKPAPHTYTIRPSRNEP